MKTRTKLLGVVAFWVIVSLVAACTGALTPSGDEAGSDPTSASDQSTETETSDAAAQESAAATVGSDFLSDISETALSSINQTVALKAVHIDGTTHPEGTGTGSSDSGEFADTGEYADTGQYDNGGNPPTDQPTSPCEGGGTMTFEFGTSTTTDNAFDTSFTVTLDRCVVTGCGSHKEVNGSIQGQLSVVYPNGRTGSEEESRTVTVVHKTASECGGLTIDGQEIGFNITEVDDKISGSVCVLPAAAVTFGSRAELLSKYDSEGACSIEQAH